MFTIRSEPKNFALCIGMFAIIFQSICLGHVKGIRNQNTPPLSKLTANIKIKLNESEYLKTGWAQPPQLAVWLENEETDEVRTLMVTQAAATDTWDGKVTCPVGLPIWTGRYFEESGVWVSYETPAADAITRATPKESVALETELPGVDTWFIYVEVNVSGDFNEDFPAFFGYERERWGNGQPSLIYRARLDPEVNGFLPIKLVGRSEQEYAVDDPIADLKGITTATSLIESIQVVCSLVIQQVNSHSIGSAR